MQRLLALLLGLLLTGCAGQIHTAATDGRAVGDQAADAKICGSIRSALLARDSGSLSVLDILCNNRLVVIAGALPPDYKPAAEAVHIATKTPGVRRVETFFAPKPAQDTGDAAIAGRIKTALAGDAGISTAGTGVTVVAGTVVLVGMVDDQAKADRIIANAGSVAGVKGVKSFIQLKP
jgi:osmotically-inducible protein OsmY